MTIYQVIHREPYEPDYILGSFLNEKVAIQYANAIMRCGDCPLNDCQTAEELDEAVRNIGKYCPFYNASEERGYCMNCSSWMGEPTIIEPINVIEDEIFDYNSINEKKRSARRDCIRRMG